MPYFAQARPAAPKFSADVSSTPGTFDVNGFIQSLMQGAKGAGNAATNTASIVNGPRKAGGIVGGALPVAQAPGAIPPPPGPAAMPGGADRLQMQRERQQFQKSILTPRHLGMSGGEGGNATDPWGNNPFAGGFLPPSQRQGLQGSMPQGDYSLIASHPSEAFTTTTPLEARGIAGAYGTPPPEAAPKGMSPSLQPRLSDVTPPEGSDFALPSSLLGGTGLGNQPSTLAGPDTAATPPPFQGGIVNPGGAWPPQAPQAPTGASNLLQKIRAGRAARMPQPPPSSIGMATNPYATAF